MTLPAGQAERRAYPDARRAFKGAARGVAKAVRLDQLAKDLGVPVYGVGGNPPTVILADVDSAALAAAIAAQAPIPPSADLVRIKAKAATDPDYAALARYLNVPIT